jgi:hypothetical protein
MEQKTCALKHCSKYIPNPKESKICIFVSMCIHYEACAKIYAPTYVVKNYVGNPL